MVTLLALLLQAATAAAAPSPTPTEIVAAAPARAWAAIPAADLLVMDLAPDAAGRPRRVVIQLLPAPFAQGWIGNIRKLAAAHWWDGTSVNRVQDNYVVQWGDATEKKPLPPGLATIPARDYVFALTEPQRQAWQDETARLIAARNRARPAGRRDDAPPADVYTLFAGFIGGFPVGIEHEMRGGGVTFTAAPAHCYGMVGVGRDVSPDTGSGAELYAVIGHAPRHLDRNIALAGRVVEGIEHLSSLPRGTGALGFYERPAERVPIVRVRLANELPAAERPRFEYLSGESDSWTRYRLARENRRDAFFIRPAGAADVCNVPVPVRRAR